ncbi:RNA polymerase II core subunit [Heterostelium album PN500]|uniref:RNA polymerase II core subunit n=1 Tax=Heterostelium pallidum (strain ATCC 26659 / Pp 5 / PN500) TaxID=670386 RepID=D3BQ93_HETP5|nr:RNA polymerase II core subunit [Heterostelium album PN500]EFA76313.1 RNA polymerase II core subunit [Heterostelium album PN500]|eukprot:XP_020428445.1 RNA polymerase II core subunit [Heterostelium album PN500]
MNNCTEHNRLENLICFECNIVGCADCLNKWEHKGHAYQSVSEIQKLGGNSKIHQRVEQLWKSIKLSTYSFESLTRITDDISNHFRQLHDYLILEESKLKIPIKKDLEKIGVDISTQINEMKSLRSIIMQIEKLNNQCSTTNKKEKEDTKSEEEEFQKDGDGNKEETAAEEEESMYSYLSRPSIDTSDMDTLATIINQCDQSSEFFKSDVFKKPHSYGNGYILGEENPKIGNDYSAINGNGDEQSILKSIQQFGDKYQSLKKGKSHINNNSLLKCNFAIRIDAKQVEEIQYNIKKSIDLKSISILTLGQNESSLLSLSDYSLKQVETLRGIHTSHSVVADSRLEHIYVFGGFDINGYQKILAKTLMVSHTAKMDGIDGGEGILACYDGFDHIYLIGGHNYKKQKLKDLDRIDRFNIKSQTFERYSTMNELIKPVFVVYTFATANGYIYMLTMSYAGPYGMVDGYEIWRFNPIIGEKQQTLHMSIKIAEGFSNVYNIYRLLAQPLVCFDQQQDTLYVFIKKHTFKIDINKKTYTKRYNDDTMDLSTVYSPRNIKTVFHRFSSTQSNIFVLGGKTYGNHIYSIEKDKWSSIESKDHCQREMCGAFIDMSGNSDQSFRRGVIQEEEDLSLLKFPKDLKNAKFLLNSEVAILLECRKEFATEGTEFPQTFHKTLAYAERFSRYKNKASIKQVRGVLSKQDLDEFEVACLANLCPENSDEAKSLIVSLKRFQDTQDDTLQAILDELSNLRKFN